MTQRTEQMTSQHTYSVFDDRQEAIDRMHEVLGTADHEFMEDGKFVALWFEPEVRIEICHLGERWMVMQVSGHSFTILELP